MNQVNQMNNSEENRNDSGLDVAVETINQYKNMRWGLDGQSITIDEYGDECAAQADDSLRTHAMFAFCCVIDPGAMEFVDVSTFSDGQDNWEIVVSQDEDGNETFSLEQFADRSAMMVGYLSDNLKEGTAKLVREATSWFAAEAVGGEEALQIVRGLAEDEAGNFESHLLADLPGTEAAIKKALAELLLAVACAQAYGRPDMVESLDYILGSFYLGNPVLGIGHDNQLIVITE
jgi:hypothetical protein